mgnify:CR=1 FL=1
MLKAQTGINLVHVPFRGLPEAHTSVIRGDAIVFMTFFSAGGDLNWMRAMADYSWTENHADATGLANMLWAIANCPVPVIAGRSAPIGTPPA